MPLIGSRPSPEACNMKRTQQKGAQAVEFALILPFFILIIFAVLDFGILVYNKAIITNASREAVRRGTMLSAATWSAATVAQTACNYARNTVITVNAAGGTKTPTCTGTADPVITVTPVAAPAFNDPITVTVNYTVRGFSLGSWYGLGTGTSVGSPLVLTATTQMNHE
jgi:Flp pilus assembly protein TadG